MLTRARRHLSRPAHRLDVNERSVSSFDVAIDDDKTCPRAGLCRRCWRSFRTRDQFEEHISQPCNKASRGKREKFQLLLTTFCDLEQNPFHGSLIPHTSSADDQAIAQPSTARPTPFGDGSTADVQPVASHPEGDPPATGDQGRLVSRQEYDALVERVAALEQMITDVTSTPGGGRTMGQSSASQAGRGRAAHAGCPGRNADKDNLVRGMNSRPTNVDRDSFPTEAQRTLSGLSSSTDKSSVRHAPLSPGGELHTPPKQAALLSDSGYSGSTVKGNAGAKPNDRVVQLEPVPEQQEGVEDLDNEESNQGGYLQEAGLEPFSEVWPPHMG